MKKVVKNALIFMSFVGFTGLLNGVHTSVAAAKARVISIRNISKKPYAVSNGYFYSSPQLTKKIHNQHNYLQTTFYSYKSATVKKSNNKQAVYYYVKNKSGSVKGWVWSGSLVKPRSYAQEKSDMNSVVKILKGMSQQVQDANTLSQFRHMDYKHPYREQGSRDGRCIASVLYNVHNCLWSSADNETASDVQADIQGGLKFYELFKDRLSLSSDDKQELTNRYDSYDDDAHSSDSNINDPSRLMVDVSSLVALVSLDINQGALR